MGWITLNRPQRCNALDRGLLTALVRHIGRATQDPSLRVLALTGAGSSFSAGADLAEVDGPEREGYLDLLSETFGAVRGYPRPLVGILNGTTVAGGLELALCCDLLLAAETARIADGHVAYGLIPGGGSATLLPRLIGPSRARQMLLTGAFETATTLRDWGLVNWVVPDDALPAEADALLDRLAALAPVALAGIKRLAGEDVQAGLAREHAAMRVHLATPTAAEGLAAFRDKRPPRFGDSP